MLRHGGPLSPLAARPPLAERAQAPLSTPIPPAPSSSGWAVASSGVSRRAEGISESGGAAGTSARALQYGFRRHLGTTPLRYLGRVRLERARRELQRADPTRGDTVAAIATRWGFANPGRFATAYRAAYGVLPGQTLRN